MQAAIEIFRALKDNYVYLVHAKDSDSCLVVDPSEAAPVNTTLSKLGLQLRLILNTHHHWDHVGGDLELKKQWQTEVYCSEPDQSRIQSADRGLRDQEAFEFDGLMFKTLAIPGHTQGQIAFWLFDSNALFVGDTVFAMGCGRLMEGTATQMWASLQKIASLPRETRIYVGHEYTENNAAFAKSMEPDNPLIQQRLEKIRKQLATNNGIAEPPTLQEELDTNPFFRPHSLSIRRNLGMETATDVEVFAKLRELRNTF